MVWECVPDCGRGGRGGALFDVNLLFFPLRSNLSVLFTLGVHLSLVWGRVPDWAGADPPPADRPWRGGEHHFLDGIEEKDEFILFFQIILMQFIL